MNFGKESFEWVEANGLPKDRMLKLIAKTTLPTIHPEDPDNPVRLFKESELRLAGRSLTGRPVGMNHQDKPILGAQVIDSEYNELEKQVEAIIYVPSEYISKVRKGDISKCSIEYTWRDINKTTQGSEFVGLNIYRVDMLEGEQPGDRDASVMLFESQNKKGRFEGEIKMSVEKLEEKIEEVVKEEEPKTDEIPVKTPEDRIKDLEEAVARLQEAVKTAESGKESARAEGYKSGKESVVEMINDAIPEFRLIRARDHVAQRLVEDLRRGIRKLE